MGPHYINIGKISFNKLESKIKDLISNPDYQENAKKIAEKMLKEDGINAFCDYVENLLSIATLTVLSCYLFLFLIIHISLAKV